MNDMINHPNHYVKNAVILEPIELTGRLNSCIGQALQYVIRRKDKGTELEDLQKAVFWLNWYKENVALDMADNDQTELDVADSECDIIHIQRIIETFAIFSKDVFTRQFIEKLFPELDAGVTIASLDRAIKCLLKEIDWVSGKELAEDRLKDIGEDSRSEQR